MPTRLGRFKILAGSLCVVLAGAFSAQAQEAPVSEEERLATRLANPIAALISVPFQFNYDSDISPADDGERATLNIQPVPDAAIANAQTMLDPGDLSLGASAVMVIWVAASPL